MVYDVRSVVIKSAHGPSHDEGLVFSTYIQHDDFPIELKRETSDAVTASVKNRVNKSAVLYCK